MFAPSLTCALRNACVLIVIRRNWKRPPFHQSPVFTSTTVLTEFPWVRLFFIDKLTEIKQLTRKVKINEMCVCVWNSYYVWKKTEFSKKKEKNIQIFLLWVVWSDFCKLLSLEVANWRPPYFPDRHHYPLHCIYPLHYIEISKQVEGVRARGPPVSQFSLRLFNKNEFNNIVTIWI